MKRCLLPTLLFVVGFAHAQSKAVDSLLKVLSTQKEDTNKVNTLLQLSREFRRAGDVERALTFSKPALELAKQVHSVRAKGKAYRDLGFANTTLNPELSLRYHQLSLQCFQELNDKLNIAFSIFYTGNAYHHLQNYSEAFRYYSQALSQFSSLNDKQGLVDIYMRLGDLFEEQQNHTEALRYYSQELSQTETINGKRGVADTYKRLGDTFFIQRDISHAIRYSYLALKIYEELGDAKGKASCFTTISWIYDYQHNDAEALINALRALPLWEQTGVKYEIARACNTIGLLYLRQGRYAEALEKHRQALQISVEEKSVPWLLPFSQSCLGDYYAKMANVATTAGETVVASEKYTQALSYYSQSLSGFKALAMENDQGDIYLACGRVYKEQKKYGLARSYFDSALRMFKEQTCRTCKEMPEISETHALLSELDSLQGDYRQALAHYKVSRLYHDSATSESGEVAQKKMQYELDKAKDSLKMQQLLTDEKLKEQKLLAVQQKQRLQIEEVSLKLSNQQKELNRLAYVRTEAQLQTEQSQRQQKEKQLTLAEKEKALQLANLKLQTTQLRLKEKEVAAKSRERNLIVVGSLACLLLGAAFWRSNWQKQRAYNLLEKQRLRTAISSDLHDEVGSALSAISIFSEMAKRSGAEREEKYLQRIGDRSRESIEKMGDIIWSINPENDNLQQILLRMKTYAAEVAEAKGTAVHWVESESIARINLNMTERKNFYLLFKEGFNNAVKYSGAKNIYVDLNAAQNTVSLRIKDDGVGFDVASTPPATDSKRCSAGLRCWAAN